MNCLFKTKFHHTNSIPNIWKQMVKSVVNLRHFGGSKVSQFTKIFISTLYIYISKTICQHHIVYQLFCACETVEIFPWTRQAPKNLYKILLGVILSKKLMCDISLLVLKNNPLMMRPKEYGQYLFGCCLMGMDVRYERVVFEH